MQSNDTGKSRVVHTSIAPVSTTIIPQKRKNFATVGLYLQVVWGEVWGN